MEDAAIVTLFWERSEDAVREVSGKYGGYCRQIAWNVLQNAQDTAECVNDVWMRAWDAIPPEKPVLLGAWLGKVARHLALNRRRREHTQGRGGGTVNLLLDELAECLPADDDVEAAVEMAALGEALTRFLEAEAKPARTVFVRRYWYADSIEDIAARYDMGESRVKSMLWRMRGRLRVFLEKEGYTV